MSGEDFDADEFREPNGEHLFVLFLVFSSIYWCIMVYVVSGHYPFCHLVIFIDWLLIILSHGHDL